MAQEEIPEWKIKVIDNVQKFAGATEVNFRATHVEARTFAPIPGQESDGFVLNTFCDGLMGITTHLVATFIGSSPAVEETAIKALRQKFMEFRAEKIRAKLTVAQPPRAQ